MYRKNNEFLLPMFWSMRMMSSRKFIGIHRRQQFTYELSMRMMSSRKFIGKLLAAVYWLMLLFGRGINAFNSAAPSGSMGTTSPGKGALVAGLTGTTQFDATTGLK